MRSYKDLLEDVLANGETHNDRTGVGTRSVFIRQWKHSMQGGFPLLTTKRVPLRWVAEELFWFLSGSTKESDLSSREVDIWKEWADAEHCGEFGREPGDLGPIYGALWRSYPTGDFEGEDHPLKIDQIEALYDDLAASPNSRRLIVTGWHPHYQRRVSLPPCHTLWQLKVHSDNSLSLSMYARSIDIFLGLPFNIASYALLLELLAFTTGRKPRFLGISFGDLHLYTNHIRQAGEQLRRDPFLLPSLKINERLWNSGFSGLLSAKWSDLTLINYQCHPKIEAPVAV